MIVRALNRISTIGLVVLILAIIYAWPSRAAVLLATPATFDAQVKAAQPGDTVALGPGAYGHLLIQGRAFDPPVTIDATGATSVASLMIRASAGVNVTGGAWRPSDWQGALYCQGSQHVRIGGVTTVDIGLFNAITVRQCDDIAVTGSRFLSPKGAISTIGSTHFDYEDNQVTGASADGIDINDSRFGKILRNRCDGNLRTDKHPDCVQMYGVLGGQPVTDVVVDSNFAVGQTQGFGNDGDKAGGMDRITVTNNVAVTSLPGAISLANLRASVVKNNTAATLPGAPYQSMIHVSQDASSTECGNAIGPGGGRHGSVSPPCAAN